MIHCCDLPRSIRVMFETARDVASTYCGWMRRSTAEGSDQLKRRFPLLVVLHLRSAPFKHDHETRFRLSDCDMAFHFEAVRPSPNSVLGLQVPSIPLVPADSQPAGHGSPLASRPWTGGAARITPQQCRSGLINLTLVPRCERAVASEPRDRSAPAKRRARERVGEFEGRTPSNKTRSTENHQRREER